MIGLLLVNVEASKQLKYHIENIRMNEEINKKFLKNRHKVI